MAEDLKVSVPYNFRSCRVMLTNNCPSGSNSGFVPVLYLSLNLHFQQVGEAGLMPLESCFPVNLWSLGLNTPQACWLGVAAAQLRVHRSTSTSLLHAEPDHMCTLWGCFKWWVQSMANLFHFPLHLASLSHCLPDEVYWFPSARKLFPNLGRCNAWPWPSIRHLWDRWGGSACSRPGGPATGKWHLMHFLGPQLKVQQKSTSWAHEQW